MSTHLPTLSQYKSPRDVAIQRVLMSINIYADLSLNAWASYNLLIQFSSLGSSKMEFSETDFFDTLTIQKDEISFVKHVFAPLYVFFTLFGFRGGGGSQRGWDTTC